MVSIIVPVYNAQQYLENCVQSILAQTYRDFQLILVNDGSTDESGNLCDGFAARDSRVTVIHQKNAGVSAARNAGLAVASGEYIGFVDADDTIVPEMYEQALDRIGDCDISMWDTVTVWSDGRTEPDTIDLLGADCVLGKEDWNPRLLRYMAGSACRCLYRRELIKDIRFPVGIKLSEDRLFNLEAMGKAKSLSYFKKGLYLRAIEEGSACHRYHGDKFEKSLLAMEFAEKTIEKYWTKDYRNVYVRAFIIDGALADIREICGPEYPGKKRLKAIGSVAAHKALEDAFAVCPPVGVEQKLLKKKMAAGLLAFGLLARLKNG